MERNTKEKITVLIASVLEREKSLKIVIKRIYDQVDAIHLVLNYYESIPQWLRGKPKVVCRLNPENKRAHDAIWSYVPDDGYVFCCDDDLLYPPDFFYNLIEALRRHEHKVVCTAHGSNIILPAADYTESKQTWGFSDRLERDIFNDLCGVGVCAFHSSTLQPSLQDFPVPFCRDLYFSLHCAKNNVKIVNVKRPSNWILPLQTPGETVYEATLNNKQLRTLKNRVMKEQLLPALHCNNHDGTGSYVLITDYGFDKRLMDKTLQTLDEVTDEQTNIVVFTDELKNYDFSSEQCTPKKKVLVQYVTPDERVIGRMGSKVLTQYRFICGLPNGSRVISADGDLYFLRDPFAAFDKESRGLGLFDIAVTTRPEQYQYPINGGMVFFQVTDTLKDFLRFLIKELYQRTWPELIAYELRFNRGPANTSIKNPNDWFVDQDMWCTAFLSAETILADFSVVIVDAGPTFNYCPHADGTQEQVETGKAKLLRAYHDESVHVLHLKSRLKELVFEGLLP